MTGPKTGGRSEPARCPRYEMSVFGSPQRFDKGGEFEDFDLGRAVGPVVAPADDDVAAGEGVAVVAEIAALEWPAKR